MNKCGKGCLPECEYFTTGGCISPFNCPYKIEVAYNNSATTAIPDTALAEYLNKTEIEEWYRSLIKQRYIAQEPINYDPVTPKAYIAYLKAYIAYLEAENANLKEQIKELKGENKQ